MDKNTSLKIKNLIADNKLEEALDVLIGIEQSKGRERYNTLILLKGKLEMLEEQELADLLDFEDLAREKGKIAHAILRMTDDTGAPPPNMQPVSFKRVEVQKNVPSTSSSSPIFKYMIFGLLGIVILFFVYKMASSETPIDPVQEPTEESAEANKKDNNIPTENGRQPKLLDFPTLDRPFNFGDIQYRITAAEVEKYSDNEIKLTLKMDLICKNNLGICYREEVRIKVDDNPVAPTERKAWEGYLEHNASTKEELVFVFESGSHYKLSLEKNSSTWERAFKILQ